MMLGAVDTVMLSQYSDNSVAAVGVVNQLIMFAFLIFEVINIGTSVLCSQYLGARMHKNMVQVVGVSLILNLVFGLFVSAILHYGATSLLSMMGLRPELMEYGVSYMKIVGVFAFFQAISLTISASLRSANKAVYPMMVTVVVNICPSGIYGDTFCNSFPLAYSQISVILFLPLPVCRAEKPVENRSPLGRRKFVLQFLSGSIDLFY